MPALGPSVGQLWPSNTDRDIAFNTIQSITYMTKDGSLSSSGTMAMNSKNGDLGLGDDLEWAGRCEYWRTYQPIKQGQPKKFKYREPLILCGHAAHIRVDHGSLLIKNGFTHYPQKQEIVRLFPGDAKLPDRIVMLDGSGGISFDALNWMSEQQIDFVRLNWRGEIANIGGNSGYCGNPELIRVQNSVKGTKKEIEIARFLIFRKIKASIETLKCGFPFSNSPRLAIERLQKCLAQTGNPKIFLSIRNILGIEGAAAAAYFSAWQGLPLSWAGTAKKPIPDSWFEFSNRKMGWRKNSNNARHPVNAMLNYGYGITTNKIRGQIIAAGLDPRIGVLHGNTKNRIPLVYDLLEPLRPEIDRTILRFAFTHTFTPGDFTISRWGGCRLNPQMVKAIVGTLPDLPTQHPLGEFIRRIAPGR